MAYERHEARGLTLVGGHELLSAGRGVVTVIESLEGEPQRSEPLCNLRLHRIHACDVGGSRAEVDQFL